MTRLSFSAWAYDTPLTAWPRTHDEYGQPTAGAPIALMGTYRTGGETQTDDTGVEFMPKNSYFFPATDAVQRGYLIAVGTHKNPPADAEIIRTVERWSDSIFGAADDMAVHT
jgi:hypothetical protein